MFTGFRLKIRNFFKRNKNKIIIIAIIWAIIIVINYSLVHLKKFDPPKTTYTPHVSVMNSGSKVPEKLQSPIEKLIDDYVVACNNKEYEKAYNLLSDECKENLYPNIEVYKKYVDSIFNTKKIYNIQNYSNKEKKYIYNVRILDDILATGLTNEEELAYYEDKFVITDNNGDLKLSIGQFIAKEEQDNVYEDDYMKISIQSVEKKYETETYIVKITNRSENILVLSDYTQKEEILLNLGSKTREKEVDYNKKVIIYPEQSNTYEFKFTKFYDESVNSVGILFNKIRVLKSYSGKEETKQKELDEAVKLYSFEMKL